MEWNHSEHILYMGQGWLDEYVVVFAAMFT